MSELFGLISGTVVDSITSLPLSSELDCVEIGLDWEEMDYIANGSGGYKIQFPHGFHRIYFRAMRYEKKAVIVEITDVPLVLNVSLIKKIEDNL